MKPVYKTRYLSVRDPYAKHLSKFPNAGPNPSVRGMKQLYWGMNAKCIRSGRYVYLVRGDLGEMLYERAH